MSVLVKIAIVVYIVLLVFLFWLATPQQQPTLDLTRKGLLVFYEIYALPIKFTLSSAGLISIIAAVQQVSIQRQVFSYGLFREECNGLYTLLEKAAEAGNLGDNGQHIVEKINTRQMLRTLIGPINSAKTFENTDRVTKFAQELNDQLVNYSEKSLENDASYKGDYVKFIKSVAWDLGIIENTDNGYKAANSLEDEIIEVLTFVSKNWFGTTKVEEIFKSRSTHHHE